MKIEIWSDVICPFCYIGKRNFEAALEQFDHKEQIEVVWKSFLLDPSISEQSSESYHQYLTKRKNMPLEQVNAMLANVTQMAKQSGLDYHLDQSIIVNSQKAHQLIQFSKTKKLGDKAEELLFLAFFTDVKNIADTESLVKIGLELGLDEIELKSIFDDQKYKYEITQDIQEAQNIGISGVPFFLFDRKYAVSGAQPSQVFLETLNTSFTKWRASNPKTPIQVIQGSNCSLEDGCN
ncbi:protein disulfide-isomerase [Flavobacterium anhuiense]|uniref:Protein disulfide-isomerase n=1 Tax=Flavobacterium anhuiense TaxID=459526 RepID=A0ABY0LZ05_9FLAO|nr:DsbA family oxidoreductase [Flavobacterium anhuiense]SCY75422.1 protein disulfide-isomerase [Flavobacterium anhuiense]